MPTILTKRDAKTSQTHGCPPDKRSIQELINSAVINLNKPEGPTSHMVSGYVKEVAGVAKAGHSGTLDPHVTGVLPIGFGRATRILEFLLLEKKEYVAVMRVHKSISDDQRSAVIKQFLGEIDQLPPIRSAVKRQWRKRNIYELSVLEVSGNDILIKVGCQAGTYVRKLIHDMGQALGVGAHMAELVRTQVGPFSHKEMITIQELRDAFWYYKEQNNEKYLRTLLHPMEFAISHLPRIWVTDGAIESLCHGAPLAVPGIAKLDDTIEKNATVAILSQKNELVCVGTMQMDAAHILKAEKGIAAICKKTLMEPGTYPRPPKSIQNPPR